MAPEEYVEVERKYDVGSTTQLPQVSGAGPITHAEPAERIELDAVYFDTADLQLARHRTVLRRRTGGADAGWHIKRAVDERRFELHWPLTEGEEDVPTGAREELRKILGDAPLIRVARISNTRENHRLCDARSALAELSDDHVQSHNYLADTSRSWREWEVELLPDAPSGQAEQKALLDEIEQRVIAAGASPSTSGSKLSRALGIEP